MSELNIELDNKQETPANTGLNGISPYPSNLVTRMRCARRCYSRGGTTVVLQGLSKALR